MDGERNERRSRCRGVLAAAVAFLSGFAGGCSREDADCLGRIGQKSLVRAEALTGDANDRLTAGWQAMRGEKDVPPAGRVAMRLQWDKELPGAEITVHASAEGVELRGKVRSAEQRQRAVELAQTTSGVEAVKDALEVAEP